MRKLLCIGHRGARGHEPENTVRSIRAALDLGADGVEIDVQIAGGELIVIHDATLKRTTNGRGRVAGKSFEYLRSLDAGLGEKIPTLREIFDAVGRRAFINIELKGKGTAGPTAELIREYVHSRGWSHHDFLVSSFDQAELSRIADPHIRLGVLFARTPRRFADIASSLGAYSLHVNRRYTNAALVGKARALGLKVFVYTVNSPREISRMRALGVDGVFTDFPERVKP